MTPPAPDPDPVTVAYGTPEMAALLSDAETSVRRTEQMLADSGVSLAEIDAAIDEMPEEIREVYEQLLEQDRAELAADWKRERQKWAAPSSENDLPAQPKPTRTRIRL